MLEVASKQNLKQAFKAVKRNKGAAGVDRVSIQELAKHLDTHIKSIQQQLLSRTILMMCGVLASQNHRVGLGSLGFQLLRIALCNRR